MSVALVHFGASLRATQTVTKGKNLYGPLVVFDPESYFDSSHLGASGRAIQNVQGQNWDGQNHPSQAPVGFGCFAAILATDPSHGNFEQKTKEPQEKKASRNSTLEIQEKVKLVFPSDLCMSEEDVDKLFGNASGN